jgi:dTDP-4-amino-4,6-dideoxygalactose transaminase
VTPVPDVRSTTSPSAVPFLDLAGMHAPLRAELDAAVARVMGSSAFVGGRHVEQFEQEWASYCGSGHAVGVANGTDAIELALRALGVGPGDEVIVPANTFIATAEAVAAVGAQAVFVDARPDTLLVDLGQAEAAVGPRTTTIIPVHLYGQPVDMDEVLALAARHGLTVIEDAAQAHGATWRGRPAGSFGHAGCFSFYPGKNLGAFGDGGAVVTDDAALAATIRSLADHGRSASSKHHHDLIGMNSRLDGLQAAILSVKLPHLDQWTLRRRAAHRRYRELLQALPVWPVDLAEGALSAHHLEVIRVDDRDRIIAELSRSGVATGIHYPVPCHLQPAFAPVTDRLPVAEEAAGQILSLPLFPNLSIEQIEWVAERLRAAIAPDELERSA